MSTTVLSTIYLLTHGPDAGRLGDGYWKHAKDLWNASSLSVNEKQMRNPKSSKRKLFVQDCAVSKWQIHDLNLSNLTPESVPSAFMHESKIPPWLNSTLYFPCLYMGSWTQLKKNDHANCSLFKFMPWHSPESLLYFPSQFTCWLFHTFCLFTLLPVL